MSRPLERGARPRRVPWARWPGFFAVLVGLLLLPAAAIHAQRLRPFLSAPIWVYNDWSAYDELSDEVPLNEALAMQELAEMLRLRKAGVRFDYYMMDAFWY